MNGGGGGRGVPPYSVAASILHGVMGVGEGSENSS